MAHSCKKHLTSRSVNKIMKSCANRKIRNISVYEDIPSHKFFRKISNPYNISDDYYNGWVEDTCTDEIIYTLGRTINNIIYNNNIWFRHFRNK